MASEKPVSGPDPQPAGLISVGAGSGGGGGGSSVAVMGELRASGSGSVVLPAGMINPSVPIRNIRMKFAVLIGLIQVGEVSNRDIVETVLNLVSGRAPRPGDAPVGLEPLGTGSAYPTSSGSCPLQPPSASVQPERDLHFPCPCVPPTRMALPQPSFLPKLLLFLSLVNAATCMSPRRACDRSPFSAP